MVKKNYDVAHEFYYRGVDRERNGSYYGCNVSYSRTNAYSYATLVAKMIPTRGETEESMTTERPGSAVTLMSMDPMSHTTGSHIDLLSGASPFDVVCVPMRRGSSWLDPETLRDNFLIAFKRLSGTLNHADARREFVALLDAVTTLRARASQEWAKPLRDRRFAKYLAVEVDAERARIIAKKRSDAAKNAAVTRKIIAKYVHERSGCDYLDFVRALYDTHYAGGRYRFSYETRKLLRSRMDDGKSYVWLDGDEIRTSRGVRVAVADVKPALTAWSHGHDMRTFRVGPYTVVKYEGEEIRIGCHRILRANLLALYEAVMGRPFAVLPKMGADVAA